jgi:hypothetical protein
MRVIAGLLCASATLLAAPAFAQAGQGGEAASAVPNTLSTVGQEKSRDNSNTSGLSTGIGFIDRLTVNSGMERPVPSLAPIEKDQLGLTWRPGGKWGITLDLTSRAENSVLPREELSAGAYYQVTPRFRFGGGVSVGGDELASGREGPGREELDTGVRLESAFSF